MSLVEALFCFQSEHDYLIVYLYYVFDYLSDPFIINLHYHKLSPGKFLGGDCYVCSLRESLTVVDRRFSYI